MNATLEEPESMELVPPETIAPAPQNFSDPFSSIEVFEEYQRFAKMLAASKDMLPKKFEGNIANCFLALEIAKRLSMSVTLVMNEIYFVYNKPSWSSRFMIACINASGRFLPLKFRYTGTKGKNDWGCIAWSYDRAEFAYNRESAEKIESAEVTIQMSKDEGWYDKPGSKWKTMPEQMLAYRAASFFTRIYAPDIAMGMKTREEYEDMGLVEVEASVIEDPNTSRAMAALSGKAKRATQITTPTELAKNRKSTPTTGAEKKLESTSDEEQKEQAQESKTK